MFLVKCFSRSLFLSLTHTLSLSLDRSGSAKRSKKVKKHSHNSGAVAEGFRALLSGEKINEKLPCVI